MSLSEGGRNSDFSSWEGRSECLLRVGLEDLDPMVALGDREKEKDSLMPFVKKKIRNVRRERRNGHVVVVIQEEEAVQRSEGIHGFQYVHATA